MKSQTKKERVPSKYKIRVSADFFPFNHRSLLVIFVGAGDGSSQSKGANKITETYPFFLPPADISPC